MWPFFSGLGDEDAFLPAPPSPEAVSAGTRDLRTSGKGQQMKDRICYSSNKRTTVHKVHVKKAGGREPGTWEERAGGTG